ncbi:MAG TPA: hypothetical protein VJR29_06735 [bacterium]|nr:hypothetical protein [bacterium]
MGKGSRLLTAVLLLAGAAALQGTTCQDTAKNVVDKAPPAKTPELVKTGGWKWSGDPDTYTGGFGFEANVKTQIFNELVVQQDGAPVTRTDVWPLPNPPPPGPVYRVMDVQDNYNQGTTTRRIHIYPMEYFSSAMPPPPPADGTIRNYGFIERSINPKYSGKEKESDPALLKLVVWNEPCVMALFEGPPANTATNIPATIRWRANRCKKVEVLEANEVPDPSGNPVLRESMLQEEIFNPGPAGTIEGNRTIQLSTTTKAVGVRLTSARGKTLKSMQETAVSGPAPCPANPGGRKMWFEFCLECLGDPPRDYATTACTQDDARTQTERDWGGAAGRCTVKDGGCFTP